MNDIDRFIVRARERGDSWTQIGASIIDKFRPGLTQTQAYNFARNCYRRHCDGAKEEMESELETARIRRECAHTNLIPETFTPGYDSTHIRIAVVSDTHFGSKYAQYSALEAFYDLCAELGIADVYHAGDLDDGSESMHVGVMYEHHCHGATEHIRNIVEHYPRREGITTHYITGNHDNSHCKQSGLLIGEEVSIRRDDMHYLGRDVAIIQLAENCTMELRHPGDGSSYAVSYKPQKIVEAYPGGRKPNILVLGHYHKALWMMHRNVHIIMAGTFCGTTPFMQSKSLSSTLGGWILDLDIKPDGTIERLTPMFVPFYAEQVDDYKSLT